MCTFLLEGCFSWSTGAPTRFTSCDQPCVPRQRLDENCDCQVGCDDRRIFRTAAPTSAQASIAQLQAGTRPSTRTQPHPPLSTLARSVLTCTSHAIYSASLRTSSTSSPSPGDSASTVPDLHGAQCGSPGTRGRPSTASWGVLPPEARKYHVHRPGGGAIQAQSGRRVLPVHAAHRVCLHPCTQGPLPVVCTLLWTMLVLICASLMHHDVLPFLWRAGGSASQHYQ